MGLSAANRQRSPLDDLSTHLDLAAKARPDASVAEIERIAQATWDDWRDYRTLPWTGPAAAEAALE